MKTNLYCIHDTVAEQYAPPFIMPNDNTATRAFVGLATDPESRISQSPSDFNLYRVGTFDDDNCQLTVEEFPVIVKRGQFAIKPQE